MQRVYRSSCRLWFWILCCDYTKNNSWTGVQVHTIKCLGIYGIEIQVPSTMSSKKTSWAVICRGQNRYVEELLHLELGPNPTSKELLRERERERADAKGTESSAAEMNQSRIEETHAQQGRVLANPACFVEETVPMGQRKWSDIPGNKWHQEDDLSTEISKLDMRLGRHHDQEMKDKSTALFIRIRWDQDCEMRSWSMKLSILKPGLD